MTKFGVTGVLIAIFHSPHFYSPIVLVQEVVRVLHFAVDFRIVMWALVVPTVYVVNTNHSIISGCVDSRHIVDKMTVGG